MGNRIEMHYSMKQKLTIKHWKENLEKLPSHRKFTPIFEFNKFNSDGIALYHLNIVSQYDTDKSVYVGSNFSF